MNPFLLFFLFCSVTCGVLLFSSQVAVAHSDISADGVTIKSDKSIPPRFSYLNVFTNEDLHSYLQENRVDTSGDESRAQLLQMVLAVEGQKEEAVTRATARGGSLDGSGVTITVKYCVGWGYKDRFAYLANLVKRRLPGVSFEHGNQEPGPTGKLIGSLTQYGLLYSLIVIGFGQLLDPNHPHAILIKANRTPIFVGGYMLMMIGGQAMSTGAFEVSIDGALFYSKLETGRMPDIAQLAELVVRRIQNGK